MSTNHESSDEEPLSQDLVFDLLSSPRRRFVLYYLRSESESMQLTDLADEVAAWEYDTPVEELTEQERKRAYVSLYQTHVPKLAEAGLIDYDTESGTIRLTDRASDVDEYLPSEGGYDIRWELMYLAIEIICVVIYVIGVIDVGVFAAVSVTVSGAIILGLFGLTTIIHYLSIRQREQRLPIELATDDER
ncbi:DUF7344 domain-containing protein [Halocatena marina]|uniref:DUF7344 domain-containing protein n=1 Tax=Halocatena marina TaxID=2934937 RepID=A0ABD5YPA8_9EURY|nr:hypothetical protein [Halocatena marina]